LNGLFAALLRGLGFSVELLSAGVAMSAGGFSPAFDHLALLVHLGEPWLADVGFGDSFVGPVPLIGNEKGTRDEAGLFRVCPDSASFVMQQWRDEAWRPQYCFDLTPHPLSDFAERNVYQQTSPDSHFTRGRICSLACVDGRISLSNLRLITTVNGQKTERDLSGEDEYREVLRDVFDVDLTRT
jgi:N-hydroxyarylamine O-acetyltransferase